MSNTESRTVSLEAMRHSCAHVLAAAVLDMFPEAQLGVGPVIEDGFYYDFLLPRTLIPEDLPLIEEKMRSFVKQDFRFEEKESSISEAKAMLEKAKQPFKIQIVDEIEKGTRLTKKTGTVSFYKTGPFVDLCKGGHVESVREIGPFKLLSIAGAYWKSDPSEPMLQRIYATCWPTAKELEAYLSLREEAHKRDHRMLGKQMDLFSFHEEGPGFVFWHPNGLKIYDALVSWWRWLHSRAGYEEVKTPYILDEQLWHRSGHWQNYKDNMYFTTIDKRRFAVKPMNCPGMILIYNDRQRSYRDLPIRMSELGQVHRNELSGVLHGLFRVRSFTIDDAHIFCREDQLPSEIKGVFNLIVKTYKAFGLELAKVELSTRPKKSVGTDSMWKQAEAHLTAVLEDSVKDKVVPSFQFNPGDGAFYGPKIDFHVKDSLGRTWQLGTIQLDFSMPDRFDLAYIGEDSKRHQPVMIHRAAFGSIERFIGILLEHTAGRLPTLLAPEQVRLITISDKQNEYAAKIHSELEEAGIRVGIDSRNESVGRKIRDGELAHTPYLIVIGEREQQQQKISVRIAKTNKVSESSPTQLIALIRKESLLS
jgi:threonyl-tRNA synthetase